MRVKALVGFVGTDPSGKKHRISQGAEFDLPPGVDWLKAGFVVEIETPVEAEPVIKKVKGKRDGS